METLQALEEAEISSACDLGKCEPMFLPLPSIFLQSLHMRRHIRGIDRLDQVTTPIHHTRERSGWKDFQIGRAPRAFPAIVNLVGLFDS